MRLAAPLALALALALLRASPASAAPNIIFNFADDFCWNCVGWKNPELHTPTLDALASSGLTLDRLYTFKYCNNKNNLVTNPGGADLRMTLLPEQLKRHANYSTAAIGKWHVGARSQANIPVNRGFDSHFGFLKGGEDHINQHSGDAGITFVDLYRDDAPAHGENGTFSTIMYAREAVNVIEAHAARNAARAQDGAEEQSLFMYLAWQAAHTPLEHPASYFKELPNDTKQQTRAHMRALVDVLDDGVKNVTDALHRAGMWEDTIFLFVADNGGWIQPTLGGNNYPLRGGKVSDFEGGVRSLAFVNGGALPPALAGTTNTALMHVTDFYATFCAMAGVECPDNAEGVPPLDSIDVSESLMTPHSNSSARTEVPLAFCSAEAECDTPAGVGDSALISGHYKLVTGTQGNLGFWQGPTYPNASSGEHPPSDPGCPQGCLFDVFADPGEHSDLRESMPDVFATMQARLAEIGKTVYQTNYTAGYDACVDPRTSYNENGGFLAPRCTKAPRDV